MTTIGILIGKQLGEWQRIDAAGNSINPAQADFDAHPIFGGIADVELDGQAMVCVPAFYYRAGNVAEGEHAGKKAVWVSAEPAAGFELHPAFRHDGANIGEFLVGKYQGTANGEKLGSQPGEMPLTNINFPAMQKRAAARGEGWMLWSIYQLAAIQMLALIEIGTPDMRLAVGAGNTGGYKVLPVDSVSVVEASYRGITGLWGNVWQMVDGLQASEDREYRVWDANGNRSYIDTEVEIPGDGWVRRRATESGQGFDLGALFLPATTRDEREDSAFGNYFWSYREGVAYHGGYYGYGANAGLFYLNVADAASYSYTYLGGRLAKV